MATANPLAATVDWLNCTFPLRDEDTVIAAFHADLLEVVGGAFAPMENLGKGLHGWRRSYVLGDTGALFAIGGQGGTAFLSLPGSACTLVAQRAWPALVERLADGYEARVSRVDLAVDDFGGTHGVEWARDQYLAEGFTSGGRPPSHRLDGDWLTNAGAGRTLYVGKRKNGKLLRVYEKGKQLGDPTSPWTRWELELHGVDREIPWRAVLEPGRFVAGAYPCTGWISEDASRIETFKRAYDISYEALTECVRQSWGPFLGTMLEREGSPDAVMRRVVRPGRPKRLRIPEPPELGEES